MKRIETLDDKIYDIPSDTRWYIFAVFTVFSWLMGLLLLYSFHKFGKLSKLDIIKKRYPVIIKLECIFCSILCIVVLPIMVINSSKLIVSTKYAYIINLSHVILTPLVSHGIANLGILLYVIYHHIMLVFHLILIYRSMSLLVNVF